MVLPSSLRTHISKSFSEDINTRLKFAKREGRTLLGVMSSPWLPHPTHLWRSKCGTSTSSRTMWSEKELSTSWMSTTCPNSAANPVRLHLCSLRRSSLQGQASRQTCVFGGDAGIARLLGVSPANQRMGQQSVWTVRNHQPNVRWTGQSTFGPIFLAPSWHTSPSCSTTWTAHKSTRATQFAWTSRPARSSRRKTLMVINHNSNIY